MTVHTDHKSPALTYPLPLYSIIFVNRRYWQHEEGLRTSAADIETLIGKSFGAAAPVQRLVTCEADLRALQHEKPAGAALFIPMSGSVQPWMLTAANWFDAVGIYPGYDPEMLPPRTALQLLAQNAAPAALEMYTVLKNRPGLTAFITSPEDMLRLWRSARAVHRLRRTRLLLIGGTEAWVLSSCRDTDLIKSRTGAEVMALGLNELYRQCRAVTRAEAEAAAEAYLQRADAAEPSFQEVTAAAALQIALEQLLQKYEADGAAVACFTLLRELNTTSCLALAFLNDDPAMVGSCEGDLDSALTLALVKALTGNPGFMGNPVVWRDFSLDLVHCSCPLGPDGSSASFSLRSHHESGTGVSPAVMLPADREVTLCRLSVSEKRLTAFQGRTASVPLKESCRTQTGVILDNMQGFMETLPGLHQILVFGSHARLLALCADLLGLEFCD